MYTYMEDEGNREKERVKKRERCWGMGEEESEGIQLQDLAITCTKLNVCSCV